MRFSDIFRYLSLRRAAGWNWSILAIFLAMVAPSGHAQNLNWEGQTGAFVTPFAYTSPSPAGSFGLPAVSFHYLDGGNVLGGFYEVSGTVGFPKRFEAGYTRAFGSVPGLSPLFYQHLSSAVPPEVCADLPESFVRKESGDLLPAGPPHQHDDRCAAYFATPAGAEPGVGHREFHNSDGSE